VSPKIVSKLQELRNLETQELKNSKTQEKECEKQVNFNKLLKLKILKLRNTRIAI